MILLGELKPGERVRQEELSEVLGVSTMPIREALLRLASEGLIETERRRSFRVVALTEADIRDVYWLQATLSGELTRRAAHRATPELLLGLHALQLDFDKAQAGNDTSGMEQANWSFHRELYVQADSSRLLVVLRRVLRYIPEGLYPSVAEWGLETVRGHARILDALDHGNAEAAAQEAVRHVEVAGELLIHAFFERGYWGVVPRPD
jgi:DNA-binding GntR family transcriptional regulator